ncbi:hypothetical protein XELAEV_18007358mg [Xenopus laevis]|uniref:GIY-YIG domain-containing protein n=1 Tax=Xenopus laevis TaxID=8355 RepID=A0A974I5A1_XENLA|nr:hypothetical protein XELAEV_18007358mg [Xenopus laevis]
MGSNVALSYANAFMARRTTTHLSRYRLLQALSCLDLEGQICTSLFTKPTDRNQILHYTSQHPPHTKKSIPISQLSRVKRLVSERKEKEKQEQIMCHKFRERRYPEKVIQQAQHKARHPKERTRQFKRIPFVTQFHTNSKTIGAHVTSTLVKTTPRKYTHFGEADLKCLFVLKGREFVQHIQLRGHYTCISKFAIYVLTCPCSLIYVGESTQMVKSRISQHRSSINLGNTTLPVLKHFVIVGHTADQLKFMVLEVVPPIRRGGDRELKLKRREVWWINMLKSLHPWGLNRDYDLFLFL